MIVISVYNCYYLVVSSSISALLPTLPWMTTSIHVHGSHCIVVIVNIDVKRPRLAVYIGVKVYGDDYKDEELFNSVGTRVELFSTSC